ncbi:hypothetical protein ABID22_002326 [Pontibacter aydingkolensis]|uniref:SWFGD domain-containing protein n=1 Tax=Pontibacter aydingkolensis TaxID=1911536 RepID=A0ABS7CVP0_9BACT|nr:hypothetical protein [Pontibacter aydingkolensis]MBW7467928.1 hypothetical protein [Pontibacter aydingkolensis]
MENDFDRSNDRNSWHATERRRYYDNPANSNYHSGYQPDGDRDYRQQDYDMERNYYRNVGNKPHDLDNIRQGYGMSSFGNAHNEYNELENMERERNQLQRQGYGAGRMGGYSGSAFGGANYSSHGDFGGSEAYGSMSGHGGNADRFVSSSGYGGGYGDSTVRASSDTPHYRRGAAYEREYRGYTSGNKSYGSSFRNTGGYGLSEDNYDRPHGTGDRNMYSSDKRRHYDWD